MSAKEKSNVLYQKRRFQVACIVALLLFMVLVTIKEQLIVNDEYEGMRLGIYQLNSLVRYALLGGSVCLLIVWNGKIQSKVISGISAIIMILLMPAVSFFIFETVAGNFFTIINNQKGIVILNLCIWYLLYAVVFALSNHVKGTVLFLNTFMYIFAVANAFVVQFREQPIMVMDIKSFWTAASVAGEFRYEPTMNMILMGLLMIACNLLICKMDFWFSGWKSRLVYTVITVGCVWYCFYGMLVGDFFAKVGSQWMDFFRFNITYQTDGYMMCTVKSIRFLHVEKPEGYSLETVKNIAADVKKRHVEEKNLPENIIVIMNEAFADLSVLGDFETSEPMLPHLSEMSAYTTQGKVYTSVYGGGTASSEFEFLTGNSMANLPATTVAYQMYVEEGDSSIVSLLKDYGYRTAAYHPYRKDNYNRPAVYNIYGFDEFYGKEDMKIKKIRKYASDKSDYQNVIQICENKKPGERLFLFNITMQNHGGYEYDKYESTVSLSDCPGEFPQAEQYLSLMQESDEAFYELIDYFSKVEEDTVILLFGDHQPKLEDGFYEKVMGAETEEISFINYQKKYITPYVLWANYDLEIEQEEYISTNYLGSYLLDTIGIELPVYNRYLLELQEKLPAINVNGFLDENYGVHWIKEEGDYQILLREYNILEYNNLFDNRNRIKELY